MDDIESSEQGLREMSRRTSRAGNKRFGRPYVIDTAALRAGLVNDVSGCSEEIEQVLGEPIEVY